MLLKLSDSYITKGGSGSINKCKHFGEDFWNDVLKFMRMLMCFDSVILNRRIHSKEISQNKERDVYTDVYGNTIYNTNK